MILENQDYQEQKELEAHLVQQAILGILAFRASLEETAHLVLLGSQDATERREKEVLLVHLAYLAYLAMLGPQDFQE